MSPWPERMTVDLQNISRTITARHNDLKAQALEVAHDIKAHAHESTNDMRTQAREMAKSCDQVLAYQDNLRAIFNPWPAMMGGELKELRETIKTLQDQLGEKLDKSHRQLLEKLLEMVQQQQNQQRALMESQSSMDKTLQVVKFDIEQQRTAEIERREQIQGMLEGLDTNLTRSQAKLDKLVQSKDDISRNVCIYIYRCRLLYREITLLHGR